MVNRPSTSFFSVDRLGTQQLDHRRLCNFPRPPRPQSESGLDEDQVAGEGDSEVEYEELEGAVNPTAMIHHAVDGRRMPPAGEPQDASTVA